MCERRSIAVNAFSIPASSSRLSPLAHPFTVNNPFNLRESFEPLLHSSSSSNSSVGQPFPYMNFGGQRRHDGYCAYQSDATAITTFPFVDDLDFEPNSCFTSYPFSSSSLAIVGPKTGVRGIATNQQGLEEVPLLEKGTTFEGSKFVCKTPSVLHEKGSVVGRKDNRIRQEDVDKIHGESRAFRGAHSKVNLLSKCITESFSISSDLSFSLSRQHTHSQLSYTLPLPTLSLCDSTIVNNERCFPHLASCAAETLVSCAPERFSYSAQTFNPSSVSYKVPVENVAYGGTDSVGNTDWCVVPDMIGSDLGQSAVDKVACGDLVITREGEKRNIVEPFYNNETENPSFMATSKLRIACPNPREEPILEQHGAKSGISDSRCSTNTDDDVDSPCWKGTQAYKSPFIDSMRLSSEDSKVQTPPRVSVTLKSERSKNEKVARNSLNPLAPVFIPGSFKQNVDSHQKECHGDGSLSSQNIGALAVISSSMGYVEGGTYRLERIDDRGMHCSSDVRNSINKYGTPYKSSRSTMVNSFCTLQPYTGEEYVTSESQLVRGTNISSCMEGILDATHNVSDSFKAIGDNGPNTSSSSFPTKQSALNSHPIGDGVSSDLTKRFQEPSKSTPPKLDVKLMINTIQYLSELVLQNYSFAFGSMSEHEHDKIMSIIHNLFVVMRNQPGERAIRPQSCHLCTLFDERQVADHPEVIEKDRKVIHLTEPEMSPEALFYRKLWLEAKAALYYQARKVHSRRINNASSSEVKRNIYL